MGRGIIWGVVLMAVGAWLWLANLGVLPTGIVPSRDWPLLIVVVGLLTAFEGFRWLVRRRR
ncbi:MAG: DUF5668 domain-containing protein [bacterium]